jgi:YVTN family beta-propeller protein
MRTAIVIVALGLAAGSAQADTDWREVDRVDTGAMPWSVSVSPDGKRLYVAHVGYRDHDAVWAYRADDLERTASVSFAGHGVETVVTADGGTVYVTNSRKREVLALAGDDLSIKRRYRVGRYDKDLALSPDGKTLYVANYGDGSVSVVDLGSGRRRDIDTGKKTRGVAISPDGGTVLATNFGDGTVSVIDAGTLEVVATVRACDKPRHAVFTAAGNRALVSCYGERRVVVLDVAKASISRSLRTGAGPKTIALAPDGSFAVTANERGNSISVIDLRDWSVSTVAVAAKKPCGVAVSPDGGRIYLTARGSNQLIVLGSTTRTASYPIDDAASSSSQGAGLPIRAARTRPAIAAPRES